MKQESMSVEREKNLLLLGATSGIGYATGLKFASKQFNLYLAARNAERLTEKAGEIDKEFHVKTEVLEFDATDTANHMAFAKKLPVNFDVVLIAFGINGEPEESKQGGAEAEKVMKTNFIGVVSVVHALISCGKIGKGSTVIVISSIGGERGKRYNYLYGASKAALSFYLDGLRADLLSSGIRVLTVKPGYVDTKMLPVDRAPKIITATCETVASDIYRACKNGRNIIYTPWYWRYLMIIFRIIPGFIFNRLNI